LPFLVPWRLGTPNGEALATEDTEVAEEVQRDVPFSVLSETSVALCVGASSCVGALASKAVDTRRAAHTIPTDGPGRAASQGRGRWNVRPLEAILLVLSLVILIAVAILFSRTSELREGIEARKGETEDVAKRVNKLETQDVLTDERLNALRELSGEVDSLRHEVARLREVEYVDRDTVRKAVEAELRKATARPEEEAEAAPVEEAAEEEEPGGPVGVPGGVTTW
jgi:hypothetical protein